jgi:hypothetical protein
MIAELTEACGKGPNGEHSFPALQHSVRDRYLGGYKAPLLRDPRP